MAEMLTDLLQNIYKRIAKLGQAIQALNASLDGLNQNIEQKIANLNTKLEEFTKEIDITKNNHVDVLREIKSNHPLIEVIMLTGHATVSSGIEGMKLGAFDYLTKPCDIEHLLTKVDEAANKKRRHEAKIMEARLKDISTRMI